MLKMKIYLCLVALFLPNIQAITKIICGHKTESITCNNGYQIKIRSVNFGRTSKIVCSQSNVNNCYSSGRSTAYIANQCNDKNACQLTADSGSIGEDPCPNVDKYLDIEYDCDQIPTTTTTTSTTVTTTPTPQSSNGQQSTEVCHEYLVSGPRGVPDNKITASSTWSNNSNDHHDTSRSRLFTTAVDFGNGTFLRGAWSAGTNDKNQYIQAELSSLSLIRGITTQGRNVNPKNNCCYQKVMKYSVEYSIDGTHFTKVSDASGNPVEFAGNVDQETPVTNLLPCPVVAKVIRLRPLAWDSHISLRWDAVGCPTTANPYGQCPTGWTNMPGTTKCYLVTKTEAKGYDDARQACRLQQGDLIKIDTVQEKNWIMQEVQRVMQTLNPPNPLYQVWIGMSNRPRRDSSNYVWVDGTPHDLSVLPWTQNMPDNYNGIEHCAELVNAQNLNDVSCNSPINYICEKDKFSKPAANSVTPFVLKPTTASVQTPSSVMPAIPIPSGGNNHVVNTGTNTFYLGCKKATDCYQLPLGDYQSCTGCHDYLTCAPSGDFVRPCPANLSFDENAKACVSRSGTCRGP